MVGLKAGTETGSGFNHIMSAARQLTPEVGMGATILQWTDRTAGTIIKVTPKTITVQEDKANRIDGNGMSESQQYDYQPNPQGRVCIFRMTKKGYRNECGNGILIGKRAQYHDYSF